MRCRGKLLTGNTVPTPHAVQTGDQHFAVNVNVNVMTVYIWDNYKDYTYVGTLDGLYQHTLIATGTRLRPLQAPFLGHILSTKPAKNIGVFCGHLGPPEIRPKFAY